MVWITMLLVGTEFKRSNLSEEWGEKGNEQGMMISEVALLYNHMDFIQEILKSA